MKEKEKKKSKIESETNIKANEKKKKLKNDKPVVKLSKEEKKRLLNKKREEWASKKGVSKIWTTLILETLYIFLIEIIFKLILGSLTFDYSLLRIFISSLILSLILTLTTCNLKDSVRRFILIGFNLFVCIYAWLQIGFMNYLGAFMSVGNAEQGTKITDYVIDFLCSYKLVMHAVFIPFIITILYFIFERRITKDGFFKKFEFKNAIKDGICIISLALLCLFYYMTLEIDFMQNKYQTIENKSLFKYPSNPSMAIKNFGSSVYFLLDIKGTVFGGAEVVYAAGENHDKTESKTRIIDDTAWKYIIDNEKKSNLNILNNYFINRNITEVNEYTGLFKDKNLIVVMLESVGSAVFSEEFKDYYPTLYKLYNEGITGVNNYSPKNNCATGESEMTSQISLYSIETTCTVNTYKNNVYPEALMSMLRKNGYYTSAYHDYTDQYYYRSVFEKNFGSTDFYSVTKLGMTYNPVYKEWPSDVTFMEKALPKFIDKEKFASYLVTVTSHAPYMYSSEWGDEYISLFKDLDVDKTTKRYLSKVKVVDLAMEYLLNELENKGILDDTVLVIFGDHYPYALSDNQYQSIANFDISVNQESDRTPFIIYNSATKGAKVTKYTTPLDYTPTILNLFGIEYDPRYYLGNDIFSEYKDFALFPDNSWQSPAGFYSASRGEFIPNEKSGIVLTDEEIIETNVQVSNLRNMSALAIKNNYFNYLFKQFDAYDKMMEEAEKQKESTEMER